MHVVFLTNEYPPMPSGGIGTSVGNLGRALVRLGHRATVLGEGKGLEWEDEGISVRFLRTTRLPKVGWLLNQLLFQREINRLVATEQAQVVEAPDWGGMSAFLRLKCPAVIRCHGSATYFAHLLQEDVKRSVRWTEHWALRQAVDVVAVSTFAAAKTVEVFNLRRSIGVIPNGIDVTHFSPVSEADVDPRTVLYFGTLARKKGALDLPAIFARLLELCPDARLVLVGRDNPDRKTGTRSTWSLVEAALPAEHRSNVRYLGVKPYNEVRDHVRKAAACIFPSYAEAFPLSWLEAMACAKPVVAYDLDWAREAIEPDISGLLVPAGDAEAFAQAIARLLNAPDERRRLGLNARRRVEEQFTTELVARASLEWYEKVLKANGNGSPA
jgi:glycosyltransferase involved in cell wall biosynthesis